MPFSRPGGTILTMAYLVVALKALVLGSCAGFASGLTGIGGGSIYVPVFFYFFGLPIKKAIGTSLLVMVLPALSAFLTHLKGRQVDFRVAVVVILSGMLATQVGAQITTHLPDLFVKTIFVIVTGGLAVPMFLKQGDASDEEWACARFPLWKIVSIGIFGGIIAGMCGVGGAILMVPLLHLFVCVPMRVCVGTVLSAVFFNSVSGLTAYLAAGLVDLPVGFLVAIPAVLCAPLGARVSMRTDRGRLRKVFAIVLILGAALVLVRPS